MREEHYVMNWKKWNWYKIALVSGLLLAFLATPALAYDFSGNFTRLDSVTSHSTTITSDGSGAEPGLINYYQFRHFENWEYLSAINYEYQYISFTWDYSVQSDSQEVWCYIGTTYIGKGIFGFNNNSATGKVMVYFYPTEWDTHGTTGWQWVNFSAPGDDPMSTTTYFKQHGLKDLRHTGQHKLVDTVIHDGGWVNPTTENTAYIGDYVMNYRYVFNNNWYITKTGNAVDVHVQKTIDGYPYKSRAYLCYPTEQIISSDLALSTNDSYQTTSIYPLHLSVIDSHENWYNTSDYYTGGGTYTITVEPSNPTPTQTITGTLFPESGYTLDSVQQIKWSYVDETGYHELFEPGNTSRQLLYTKLGTNWYQFDPTTLDYTTNKGTTIPNPVTFTIPASGDKVVTCRVIDSIGRMYDITASLTMGAGYVTTKAKAVDYLTGNKIRGATISIWDTTNASWTNTTTSAANNDEASIATLAGHIFNIYANASGYTSTSRFGLQASSPGSTNTYALTMYSTAYVAPPSGNTILYATVTATCQQQYQGECSDLPLSGVTIAVNSVDGTTFSGVGVTGSGSSGTVTMYVPNWTAYFWSASGKAGYESVSGNFTLTDQPVYTLSIQMSKIFVTPTPSGVTPLPTGVTPTPTKGATQSEGEYQAGLGLDILAGALVGWFKVGVGIVSLWLLWVLVYEATGGKVIEKIMRRGRKGK